MNNTQIGPGRLVLVVGPSGAGVDTLIDAAKRALKDDAQFRFVQRTITRAGDAGGEDHVPATEVEFRERLASGAFALHWQAHGYWYGIPQDIDQDIESKKTVVANVSRSVLDEARTRYENLCIASVSVSKDALAIRLAHRNRESTPEIERRLARAEKGTPVGPDVVTIDNNGPIEGATTAFTKMLLNK